MAHVCLCKVCCAEEPSNLVCKLSKAAGAGCTGQSEHAVPWGKYASSLTEFLNISCLADDLCHWNEAFLAQPRAAMQGQRGAGRTPAAPIP